MMKVRAFLITIVILSLGVLPCGADTLQYGTDVFEEHEEYNGYDGCFVLCESLSLRENPDTASQVLVTLEYGAHGTIMEENDSWFNVVYSDEQGRHYEGWIKKDYVLVNPSYFTPGEETPVYAIPSTDSKRVGLISGDTDYPIIGEYNGFLAISLRGASGFVVKR